MESASKDSKAEEVERRWNLISRGLAEIVGQDEIKALLAQPARDLKVYWGTATTGKPHFGYMVPVYKIADYLNANCHVTILFADLHAYLDNMKSSWELLKARCIWYEFIIKQLLLSVGVPLEKLRFIRGTEFQLKEEYTTDLYKLCARLTTEHTSKAGAEVVKQSASPLLSSLLYPILQALDEQYLGVDVQFGGVDQRKIFMFARENLPKLGYNKRSHLMNPLIPGLGESGKMSSSEPLSKIDFDDTDEIIEHKIMNSFSIDGKVEGNGMLAILHHVLFKYLEVHNRTFVIPHEGGDLKFSKYSDLEDAFAKKEILSLDLKKGVCQLMKEFIQPLRAIIDEHRDWMEAAYPTKTS